MLWTGLFRAMTTRCARFGFSLQRFLNRLSKAAIPTRNRRLAKRRLQRTRLLWTASNTSIQARTNSTKSRKATSLKARKNLRRKQPKPQFLRTGSHAEQARVREIFPARLDALAAGRFFNSSKEFQQIRRESKRKAREKNDEYTKYSHGNSTQARKRVAGSDERGIRGLSRGTRGSGR